MPQPAGWARLGAPTTATGTGASLVVDVPTGVVDGVLLLLTLTHRSGGFATVPAAWTLLNRDTTGTVWVECYWRRASSEPASYTITGLATLAIGSILARSGVVVAGSPVDTTTARVVTTASNYRLTETTSTTADALVVAVLGSDTEEGASTLYFNVDATSPFGINTPTVDPALGRLPAVVSMTTASGGGGSHFVHEAIQPIPGPTGQGRLTQIFVPLVGQSVGILAVLIPETAASTPGTRYYPGYRPPAVDVFGPLGATYDATATGPRGFDETEPLWELTQWRSRAGDLQHVTPTRNAAGVDCLTFRACTPPLAAGTLGGTFDLCQYVTAQHVTDGTPVGPDVRFRVFIYATIGDSTAIRGVLLDYVDTVAFPVGSTVWRSLASPQALSPVARQAGDRILVEVGVRIAPQALGAPTRPPSEWIQWQGSQGTAVPSFPGQASRCADVPWSDAPAGTTNADHAPWMAFSETVPELGTTPTTPPHTTCATARTITVLPYSDVVDTRTSPAPQRAIWYQWTADVTGRVIAHVLGSTGGLLVTVYTACGADLTGAGVQTGTQTPHRVRGDNQQAVTAVGYVVVDAVAGTTYRFRVRQNLDGRNAAGSGGRWVFSVVRWQALAANDVILASTSHVARYTSQGVLADLRSLAGILSGVAIDYTLRPMDVGGSPHTQPRLLVGVFNGLTVAVLDLALLDTIDEIFSVLPFTADNVSSLAVDAAGRLFVGFFGNGFTRVANTGSSYLDAAATAGTAPIAVTDATFGDGQPAAPFPAATLWSVALDAGGTNYLDLTPDGSTLYYTSGGWYVPAGGVFLRGVETGTGSEIDSRTVVAGPGPNPGLKGLQPLADGTLLVCNGSAVQRVTTGGTVLQSYLPTPANRASSLADVEVQEDGQTFWVLDEASTTLHKFDLVTGAQLLSVYTRLGYGTSTSFVIYRPNGVVPPPTSTLPTPCPAILDPLPVGGRVCPVTLTP